MPWRLLGKLFTLFSALSFAHFVALVSLWVRSYFVGDGYVWSDGVRVPTAGYSIAWRQVVLSYRGKLQYVRDRNFGAFDAFRRRMEPDNVDIIVSLYTARSVPGVVDRRVLGVGYTASSGYPVIASTTMKGPPVVVVRVWTMPYWLPTLITTAMPAIWIGRRRRRLGRIRAGLCITCGYDLRASPERCPECGTINPERGALREPKFADTT